MSRGEERERADEPGRRLEDGTTIEVSFEPRAVWQRRARLRLGALLLPFGLSIVACHVGYAAVAAPYWLVPAASAALLCAGAFPKRAASRTTRRRRMSGPFRERLPTLDAVQGVALVHRRAGFPAALRMFAGVLLVPTGALAALCFTLAPWRLLLPDSGAGALILFAAATASAILLGGLLLLWPRSIVVLSPTGVDAYRSYGIGPLELMRCYVHFATKPEVSLLTSRSPRSGSETHDLVLTSAPVALVVETFDTVAGARTAAERCRRHLTSSTPGA